MSSHEAAVIEFINPYSGGSAQAGDEFEGHPSKAALDVMLASLGWTHEYFDWEHSELAAHPEMADYSRGQRVTAVVDCKRPTISPDAQAAAVKAVTERRLGRRWQGPTIKEVAKEYGLTPQALRTSVSRAERAVQSSER